MSFWGCTVSASKPIKIDKHEGQLLHLSQACLEPEAPKGASAKLVVEHGGNKYAVASLREGGMEFCALDLFVDSDAQFTVIGKAGVHLTGYFESDELMDDASDNEQATPAKSAKAVAPKATTPVSPAKAAAPSPAKGKRPHQLSQARKPYL